VILPDNEELRMQCLQATLKRHSSGKFLMKAKEDMVKDGLESPDEADAVLGAMMPAPQVKSVSLVEMTRNYQLQTQDEDDNQRHGERRFFT
jgi:hypothetical protein